MRGKSIDERIHSLENRLKAVEEAITNLVKGFEGDIKNTLEYLSYKTKQAKELIDKLTIKSDDPYFKVIARPTLVVVHDPTEGKARVIGYFAGIHPITYRILVCRRVIRKGNKIELINVKELPLRKDCIVNKNLEDSTVIILDPIHNEVGTFISDKDLATILATLTALKSETVYLKNELAKYKYLVNFLDQELKRMGEDLCKFATQVSVYEAERSRLLAQMRAISGKVQAMYNYMIELEKISGEKYKAKFETMRRTLEDLIYDLQETYMKEIDTLLSAYEKVKQDIESFKQKITQVSGTYESEELRSLKDHLLELEKKILKLESELQRSKQSGTQTTGTGTGTTGGATKT